MLFSFIEAQELIFLHRRDHNWWPGSNVTVDNTKGQAIYRKEEIPHKEIEIPHRFI